MVLKHEMQTLISNNLQSNIHEVLLNLELLLMSAWEHQVLQIKSISGNVINAPNSRDDSVFEDNFVGGLRPTLSLTSLRTRIVKSYVVSGCRSHMPTEFP